MLILKRVLLLIIAAGLLAGGFVWGRTSLGRDPAMAVVLGRQDRLDLFGNAPFDSLAGSYLKLSVNDPLQKEYLTKKQASCRILSAQRAQLIQLLTQPIPDRPLIFSLIDEIGQEQVVLEKATLEHLLALGQRLEPDQRQRLYRMVGDQLRTACELTACGMTSGCEVTKKPGQQ